MLLYEVFVKVLIVGVGVNGILGNKFEEDWVVCTVEGIVEGIVVV